MGNRGGSRVGLHIALCSTANDSRVAAVEANGVAEVAEVEDHLAIIESTKTPSQETMRNSSNITIN